MAGSDDGKFFIWDRRSGNIARVLVGDESIVNCLQGHPDTPLLATSGGWEGECLIVMLVVLGIF